MMMKGFFKEVVTQTPKIFRRNFQCEYWSWWLLENFVALVPLAILPTKVKGGSRACKRLNKMLPIGHRVRGDVMV